MPSFAILRIAKHKDIGTIRAASSHMTRSRDTANADPGRRASNEVLIGGPSDPADLVEARIEDATTGRGVVPRKNGVRALEVFLGTSPEWFDAATPDARRAWKRQSAGWLTKTFGDENVVSLVLHDDETTPHLTGFIVPVDPTTGRMNAARWTDGKQKLEALQTSYADSVGDLGLVRGIAGSTATHQTVREFYGALRAEIRPVVVPSVAIPPLLPGGRGEWAAAERERLEEAMAPDMRDLQMKARAGLVAAERVKTLQADNAGMREMTDRVRAMPLPDVIRKLGLLRDNADETQYRDAEGRFRITVTPDGRKFYDHSTSKGGGGAIDLVKHVMETDFKGAVAWLAGTSGAEQAAREVAARAVEQSAAIVADAQRERPTFQLPSHPPDRVLIHRYLAGERGLSPKLVDHLVDAGQITSDARHNLAFVMSDEHGVPRGIELKGTAGKPFTGLAPGSSPDATFRVLADPGRTGNPPRVVIAKSAIDALSYLQLRGDDGGGPVLVASSSGARSVLPESLKAVVTAAPAVGVAYDYTGDNAAARLLEALSSWYRRILKRLRPRGSDWNDDLTSKGASQPSGATRRASGRREQGLEL